jgi:hypothetical protein
LGSENSKTRRTCKATCRRPESHSRINKSGGLGHNYASLFSLLKKKCWGEDAREGKKVHHTWITGGQEECEETREEGEACAKTERHIGTDYHDICR